jgi:hypothetical protein
MSVSDWFCSETDGMPHRRGVSRVVHGISGAVTLQRLQRYNNPFAGTSAERIHVELDAKNF